MLHEGCRSARPTIEQWAMGLAHSLKSRSTCPRRQVGAVALDKSNRVVSVAYSGVPRGFPHCTTDTPCPGVSDPPGDTSNCFAVHAEENAIVNAIDPSRIARIFTTVSPCLRCSLLLANLPELSEVWYPEEYSDKRGLEVLDMRGIKLCFTGSGEEKHNV